LGREVLLLQLVVDPRVDGVSGGNGEGFLLRHLPGPVFVVGGALLDPLREQSGVLFGEVLLGVSRRHALLAVGGGDAVVDFTFVEVTGDDGGAAEDLGVGAFGGVEAEIGLTGLFVGTVALETVVREDRHDIPAEINRGFRRDKRTGNEQTKGGGKEATHTERQG